MVINGALEVPNKAWVLGAVNGDLKVHCLTVGSTGKLDRKVDCQLADIARAKQHITRSSHKESAFDISTP